MTKRMRRTAASLVALALATGMAVPALAGDPDAETVVATVNGTAITLGQMVALRENLPQQYLALPDDVLFRGIMDQLVQQEVLAQSVKAQTPRDRANLANDARGYLSGTVIAAIARSAVTDAALQKAYDAKYADAAPATEYHAAHILVDSEEKANELKKQIDAGADFAELAKANSTDPGSGAQGGDLGWFGPGMMVKPFEEAVVSAPVGKVVGPVKTDFGWHLILVAETRAAKKPALDDVREELATEIENAAVEARIRELTEAAKIEKPGENIDPAALKNAALID